MPKKRKRLPTVWRVPDDVWALIQPLLPPEKPAGTPGRPAVAFRRVLDGILYVLRTGCQWKALPKEFGSGSTCHRRFQEWERLGLFEKLWQILVSRYDELRGIQWQFQSLDSVTVKAPLGGAATGPNPTDRAKSGTKRHVLTDRRGAPLAVTITAANVHDMKACLSTVDSVIVSRPEPRRYHPQHLCLDKGYDFPEIDTGVRARGYRPHIRRRGEEAAELASGRHPARRWVVERTGSWHNRFRKLLIRWEKKVHNYLALVHFARCLIVYRLIVLG